MAAQLTAAFSARGTAIAQQNRRVSDRRKCALGITWRLLGEKEGLMTQGRVHDVSKTGMCLHLDAPVRAGGILVAVLDNPPAGLEEAFLLRIKHVKLLAEGGWQAGCSFTRKFTETEFQLLARIGEEVLHATPKTSCGRPEKRLEARENSVKMPPLRLKPVNLLRPEVAGRLKNQSKGGLGVISTAAFPAGTVLNVRLEQAESSSRVQVRVKYCRQFERQWLLGCQFTETPAPALLAQFKG